MPSREVADYSVEECSRLRDAFSSVAADYRRHVRIGDIGFGGLVLHFARDDSTEDIVSMVLHSHARLLALCVRLVPDRAASRLSWLFQ